MLYYITGARNKPERNAAGKLARVVDYLHREGIGGDAAADTFKCGGIGQVLKSRGGGRRQRRDQKPLDDVQDFDQEDEPDEARSLALSSNDITDEIFDPEEDSLFESGAKRSNEYWAQK